MIVFSFPEQTPLARHLELEMGAWDWRLFPDGKSYVRVLSDPSHRHAMILCSLNQPDSKALPLLFLARTLRELGAQTITWVAPYLGYMRQDKRFLDGEALTSAFFADLISPHIDALITVDPHLHRHAHLQDIYACQCTALTAAPLMAQWIHQHMKRAIIIGPDAESEQWVRSVAQTAQMPYVILKKTRYSDHVVDITLPDLSPYRDHTPILVDDMISTAGTMIKTVQMLTKQGFSNIACLATHGLFSGDAYGQLQAAGATRIITANTVPHITNGLNIAPLIRASVCPPAKPAHGSTA